MLDTLPQSISVAILSDWVNFVDISHLDVAYCNRGQRKDFHEILGMDGFVCSGSSAIVLENEFLRWLSSRKVRVTTLNVREVHNFMQYNIVIAKSVRHLRALSIDHLSHGDIKLIESSIRSASQLRDLKVRFCRSVMSLFAMLSLAADLRSLDISGCAERITDQLVIHLQRWPNLETFCISNCLFANEQVLIDSISICPKLSTLIMKQCLTVTDDFFAHLHILKETLIHLEINALERLTDGAVEAIIASGCDKLETLCIGAKNKITATSLLPISRTNWSLKKLDLTGYWALDPNHMERFAEAFPELTYLNLGGCSRLSDATLIFVASHCEDLLHLDVNYCYKISDASVMCLAACCRRLRSVDLSYCNRLTDLTVTCLFDNCRELMDISVACCTHLTDVAVMHIAECSSDLRRLNLSGCLMVTDVGILGIIAGCQELRSLEVSDNQNISDVVVMAVEQRAKHLKFLNIAYCNGVSDDAISALKKARRSLSIQSLRYLSY